MKKLLPLITALSLSISAKATPINVSGATGEATLQTILNPYGVGDVNTTQLASDSYWFASSLSGVILAEIAGYAGDNAFGIYQQGTPANKLQVFAGSNSASFASGVIPIPVGWTSFGFYLTNPNANFTWYSDASLNAGGGLDHFVTFNGTGANNYLIGIEDLNLGDYDYNDMVVSVHLNRVSETSSTLALLGMSFMAAYAARRLKR